VAPAPVLLALFFASGFAGLVYELLWVRELALVFGNTAQSAATTLAVFFLGLSAGQRAAGRRAARARHPLKVYATLEALVAATAGTYFAAPALYRAFLPGLFAWFGNDGVALTAARALLGAAGLLPLCICMGATLPVMGHLLVRRADALAPTFGVLYSAQTVGGALGALAAGFYLPARIGYARTYLLAMGLSAGIAALAFLASYRGRAQRPETPSSGADAPRRSRPSDQRAQRWAAAIACVSGFAALAIEVLWTHMFTQALHNSIYSFAVILVTFLVALSLGGLLARRLARALPDRPLDPLVVILALSGFGVALSPFVFDWLTGGLQLYASGQGWGGYMRATFACAAAVMLAPGILLGSVFPYTLRLAQRSGRGAAAVIGDLAFWNTVGAVAGSLCAGFVALPWLGLWSSLRATALLYLLAAAATAGAAWRPAPAAALAAAGAALLFSVLDPTRLPRVSLAPGETLKALRESADGTVAVTEHAGVLVLKLDGHYTVGASGALTSDRRQAELPMLLHPNPRSIFFLGLGTGITAGAALFHPVERVTVAELVPDVARAAREYFAPMTNGLFSDPRARVVIGDGRSVLAADPRRYDVIVGDLFVPWHPGTANLYTREHFERIRSRLTDDGLFAQWLPLYQLSMREFATIAHTMLDVFPLVTMWRGDFSPTEPIVALIGHRTPHPLDLAAVVDAVRRRAGGAQYPAERARALTLLFYAGNLTPARALFATAPINSDDRPVIEFLAPATPMEVLRGRAEWLTGLALSRLWAQLAATVPPDEDPYLASVPAEERRDVDAGRLLHDAAILGAAGQEESARAAFAGFASRVPSDVAAAFGAPPRE
jgi:spermidine synthase